MKKIAITLMLLCCTTVFSTSAWALEQDTDGTYLIGTSEDWDGFANETSFYRTFKSVTGMTPKEWKEQ